MWNKYKQTSKIIEIFTININGQTLPIKREWTSECIKKNEKLSFGNVWKRQTKAYKHGAVGYKRVKEDMLPKTKIKLE